MPPIRRPLLAALFAAILIAGCLGCDPVHCSHTYVSFKDAFPSRTSLLPTDDEDADLCSAIVSSVAREQGYQLAPPNRAAT